MALFIHGIGAISPAPAFGALTAMAPVARRAGNRLHALEPNYADYLDARVSRRMSRVVKMGTVAALQALHDAGLTATDGVIAGTGWGCLEDTVAFLQKMVTNQEELLSPTSFIHSTHNTIASQVAYQLKCRGYNNTYVHRNISFESALLDATLLLLENPDAHLLIGGIDELTDTSFDILTRLKTFKEPVEHESESDTLGDELYAAGTPGTWAGEGSTFFAVSGRHRPDTYAQLLAVRTVSFSTAAEAAAIARTLLAAHGYAQVDLLLSGDNGDATNDIACHHFMAAFGHQGPVGKFKHWCGEYPTASAFALGLAAAQLAGRIPVLEGAAPPRSILIYNRFQQAHQSLMLLAAC